MNIVGCMRCTTHHGYLGGMEIAARKLYEGLVSKGHSVVVVSSSLEDGQKKLKEFMDGGVKYIFLPECEPGKYSDAFHKGLVDVFNHDLIGWCDIVHSTSAGASSLSKAAIDAPIVATWHGTMLESELDKVYKYDYLDGKRLKPFNIERLVVETILPRLSRIRQDFSTYDHHVVISEYMREIVSLYDVDVNSISHIPNSIASSFSECSEKLPDIQFKKSKPITLGMVGRAVAGKGHKILADALADLDPDIFELLLVGAGPEVEMFQSVPHTVKTVKLDYSDMPMAYNSIDIFINPTLRLSGLDLTILESLACGTPVVVSNLPQYQGFADKAKLSESSGPIYTFQVGDPNSLSNAIRYVSKNLEAISGGINKAARNCLVSDEEAVDLYESLFERLVESCSSTH